MLLLYILYASICAGAVRVGHCCAPAALDWHVLRWCELCEGAGQSKEDTGHRPNRKCRGQKGITDIYQLSRILYILNKTLNNIKQMQCAGACAMCRACSIIGCNIKGRMVVMTTRQRLNIVSLKRLYYWQASDTSKHHWIAEWEKEYFLIKYFNGVFGITQL